MIGNRRLFNENNVDIKNIENYLNLEEEKGQTAVIVGSLEEILGIISIADIVRNDAKELIANLKSLGIKKNRNVNRRQ